MIFYLTIFYLIIIINATSKLIRFVKKITNNLLMRYLLLHVWYRLLYVWCIFSHFSNIHCKIGSTCHFIAIHVLWNSYEEIIKFIQKQNSNLSKTLCVFKFPCYAFFRLIIIIFNYSYFNSNFLFITITAVLQKFSYLYSHPHPKITKQNYCLSVKMFLIYNNISS